MPIQKTQHPAVAKLLNLRTYLQKHPVQSDDAQAMLLALIEVGLADRHNVKGGAWFTGNTFYWERATAAAWKRFYEEADLTTKR